MRLATFFLLAMSVLLSACQTTDAKNCSPASKDDAALFVYRAVSIEDATKRFGVEPTFKFGYERGSVRSETGQTYNKWGQAVNSLTGGSTGISLDVRDRLRQYIRFKKGVLHICK